MTVFTDSQVLQNTLKGINWNKKVLLMMSSGTFHGIKIKEFARGLIEG